MNELILLNKLAINIVAPMSWKKIVQPKNPWLKSFISQIFWYTLYMCNHLASYRKAGFARLSLHLGIIWKQFIMYTYLLHLWVFEG